MVTNAKFSHIQLIHLFFRALVFSYSFRFIINLESHLDYISISNFIQLKKSFSNLVSEPVFFIIARSV